MRASAVGGHFPRWVTGWQGPPRPAEQRKPALEPLLVPRIVEPTRRAARMRERYQERVVEDRAALRASDDIAERRLAPQPVDRERPDEHDDLRSHERELRLEPRPAERDLRRRW